MANALDGFLQQISSQAHVAAGVEDGAEVEAQNFLDTSADIALAGVTHMVDVPVQNGHGELTSDKKTTFFVTIEGTATITAPANGTWNVTATDLVANKTVFQASGMGVNQPKQFSYKTGFSTQLRIVADWSENSSTTLVLELDTNH
jgi:type IV pilus biogenesis protein CpaD/CtpE